MLGSREDAEDVVQETFAAAYGAMVADERPINVKPWLYRIARNRALNHMRRQTAIGVDDFEHHVADNGPTTADTVHKREEFRQLIGDVRELPETQRTALLLREIDALSYDQIAEAMETTVPSVKSLLVRARVSLAEASEARKLTCERGPRGARRGRRGPGPPLAAGPPPPARLRALRRLPQVAARRPTSALALMLPSARCWCSRSCMLAQLGTTASAGSGAAAGAAPAGRRRRRRRRDLGRHDRGRLEGGRHGRRRGDRHRGRGRGRPRAPRQPAARAGDVRRRGACEDRTARPASPEPGTRAPAPHTPKATGGIAAPEHKPAVPADAAPQPAPGRDRRARRRRDAGTAGARDGAAAGTRAARADRTRGAGRRGHASARADNDAGADAARHRRAHAPRAAAGRDDRAVRRLPAVPPSGTTGPTGPPDLPVMPAATP